MKVFISVDLEGACGTTREADIFPGALAYPAARANMQADLEASVAGALDAGADQIVVCDGHSTGGNIDAALLPDGVELVSGWPTPHGMMEGLDDSFDAALFVGYHARAGTANAVIEHTWTFDVFSVSVAGRGLGEFGLNALYASSCGVPTVYASGDDKLAAEVEDFMPGITRTIVKYGLGRSSARILAPLAARAAIREDVKQALFADPPAQPRWDGHPLILTFTRAACCEAAERHPMAERRDGRTVAISGGHYRELYESFLACMYLSEGAS